MSESEKPERVLDWARDAFGAFGISTAGVAREGAREGARDEIVRWEPVYAKRAISSGRLPDLLEEGESALLGGLVGINSGSARRGGSTLSLDGPVEDIRRGKPTISRTDGNRVESSRLSSVV